MFPVSQPTLFWAPDPNFFFHFGKKKKKTVQKNEKKTSRQINKKMIVYKLFFFLNKIKPAGTFTIKKNINS